MVWWHHQDRCNDVTQTNTNWGVVHTWVSGLCHPLSCQWLNHWKVQIQEPDYGWSLEWVRCFHSHVLPRSASSRGHPSPSSFFLLVHMENYKWTLELICLLQTTANPPSKGETGTEDKRDWLKWHCLTGFFFFFFNVSICFLHWVSDYWSIDRWHGIQGGCDWSSGIGRCHSDREHLHSHWIKHWCLHYLLETDRLTNSSKPTCTFIPLYLNIPAFTDRANTDDLIAHVLLAPSDNRKETRCCCFRSNDMKWRSELRSPGN